MRTRATVFALAAAICCAGEASGIPETCALALRRALDSSAAWTMERRFPEASRTLVSTGAVECVAGRGIVWRTAYPFPSSIEMTPDGMVFDDEDGRREKPLDSLPHYADIRRMADSFENGDSSAFDSLFDISHTDAGDGGWTLSMAPKRRDMRRVAAEVVLSGGQSLTGAVIRAHDGSTTSIHFEEVPSVR